MDAAHNLILRTGAAQPLEHRHGADPRFRSLSWTDELKQVAVQDAFARRSNLTRQRQQVVVLARVLPKNGKARTLAQLPAISKSLNGSNTALLFPLVMDEQRSHFAVSQLVGTLQGNQQIGDVVGANFVTGQAGHRLGPLVAGGARIGNVVLTRQTDHELADTFCGNLQRLRHINHRVAA